MKTALIAKTQIATVLDMEMVIRLVDEVFKAHGNNNAILPPKITLDLLPLGISAWTNAMPAYIQKPYQIAGLKWAGGHINNPQKGLGYIMATIILQQPETGEILAIMDGIEITNYRTGAVAGVCAKYLAKDDSNVVAIIGAGQQGRTSLMAITQLFHLQEARVYDSNSRTAEKYVEEMEPVCSIKIRTFSDPQEAVKGAHIVVTATPVDEPIVKDKWLEPGVLSISLGSYQEFDEESVLQADKVLVDNWEQCKHRGELRKPVSKGSFSRDMLYAEIGEVASGSKPGRLSPTERIMAVPIGLGTHDIAIAYEVYQALKGSCTYFEFS